MLLSLHTWQIPFSCGVVFLVLVPLILILLPADEDNFIHL